MELTVNLQKKYNNFQTDIRFSAGCGITVLFGRSGCGKTTALKMIAGLIKPDDGVIRFDEEVIFHKSTKINQSPQQRRFGFVYQEHALFPHLNIVENIAFGAKSLDKQARLAAAMQKISSFRLDGQEKKYPHEISGGQQQRAAIARAIIGKPRLLLLDEPFSAIDSPNRLNMRECLKRVILKLNLPVILVTHDLNEAFSIGSQIIILENGHIVQQGTPQEIVQNPACSEVKELIHINNYQLCNILQQ